MFAKNVGSIDRALRILFGVVLLMGFIFHTEAAYRWAYLIGIIPLATGLMSSCPIYSIFGINTCPMKK